MDERNGEQGSKGERGRVGRVHWVRNIKGSGLKERGKGRKCTGEIQEMERETEKKMRKERN